MALQPSIAPQAAAAAVVWVGLDVGTASVAENPPAAVSPGITGWPGVPTARALGPAVDEDANAIVAAVSGSLAVIPRTAVALASAVSVATGNGPTCVIGVGAPGAGCETRAILTDAVVEADPGLAWGFSGNLYDISPVLEDTSKGVQGAINMARAGSARGQRDFHRGGGGWVAANTPPYRRGTRRKEA
jgi:hypothetical protein